MLFIRCPKRYIQSWITNLWRQYNQIQTWHTHTHIHTHTNRDWFAVCLLFYFFIIKLLIRYAFIYVSNNNHQFWYICSNSVVQTQFTLSLYHSILMNVTKIWITYSMANIGTNGINGNHQIYKERNGKCNNVPFPSLPPHTYIAHFFSFGYIRIGPIWMMCHRRQSTQTNVDKAIYNKV